ncbi:DUF1413 domain-containing protein [Halobacillus campisalis]|uniref:DUF1413 domain-containing protein n=1 Tax=Halobacillus campisalis TaxID=435909 RepID=A0ABW2K128_9BACI|nr:DUF1413 domain-containing protein [Halobacillus campisalis]
MTPNIKLELSQEEYEKVTLDAYSSHCPSIREYLRLLLFNEPPSYDYEDLLWQVAVGIGNMEAGTRFLIRELITEQNWNEIPLTVRKNLGRMVIQSVLNGTDFTNIIPDRKDSQGVQWYRKK